MRNCGESLTARWPNSLLGLFEATITPAFTLVTSQWYRKNEQGTRTGGWLPRLVSIRPS
jgi:hypothetical protein